MDQHVPVAAWLAAALGLGCAEPGRTHRPDPEPTFLWDADKVLVVPDGDGLTFLAADGTTTWERTWTEAVGDCDDCGGEGASDDGDGLLLSFTTKGATSGGAVARLDAAGELVWRVDGFQFPHDAERDPADGTVLVPEVGGSEVTWIAGDGSSVDPVRQLDHENPAWEGDLPNGAERFDHEGRSYLLLSHRGLPIPTRAGGFVTCWDLTVPGEPTLVWRYPEEGALHTPHGAVVRWFDGHRWLVYAHTEATLDTGTVGLAWLDDPTLAPEYVADLVPTGPTAPFEFLRGVELTTDGNLWLTDSGTGNGVSLVRDGRVLRATMPQGLSPGGASGSVPDLVSVSFAPEPFADDLVNPFEGWLWTAPGL